MTRNYFKVFSSALLAFAILISCSSVSQAQEDSLSLKERLKQHIQYLASNELQGRFPGSPGDKMAADYIIGQYKRIGLKPPADGFKQVFQVPTGLEPTSESNVFFNVIIPRPGIPKDKLPKVKRNWELWKDWVPSVFSKSGTVSGELLFAGYGISAPELNYDDYAGVDANGKIVIAFTNSPDKEEEESPFAPYEGMYKKAQNAKKHGAVAILFIKIKGDSASIFDPLTNVTVGEKADIISMQVNRYSIAKFFPRKRALFPLEQRIDKKRQPESFVLPNTEVHITVGLQDKTDPTANIIGMVEGTDPALAGEYIVIGANHDHLGKVDKTIRRLFYKPTILNGADDNASGVAGLIELASAIKRRPMPRPVMFVCFGGEEMGLVGSQYFMQNPPIPKENIIAMLNLNMIGRISDDRLSIYGTDTSPLFGNILDTMQIISDLEYAGAVDNTEKGDHEIFYKANIPVLMFSTGIHEDWKGPSDTWNKIHYNGMTEVLDYIEGMVRRIGSAPKPSFNAVADIYAEKPSEAGKPGPWLGIIPETYDSELIVKGFKSGSPARRNIKRGDKILKLNDIEIKNYFDLVFAIKDMQPGETVSVEVLREEEEEPKVFEIKLGEK